MYNLIQYTNEYSEIVNKFNDSILITQLFLPYLILM